MIRLAAALFGIALFSLGVAGAHAQQLHGGRTPSAKGARVYFHSPLDGATVPTSFIVRIGLENMGVAPAGVDKPNTGHHHLLIDTGLPPLDKPVPNDFNHLHLGNGQTEIRVTLPPGVHTLQLLFADHDHIPHNPPVISKRIHIRVRPDAAEDGE